MTNPVRNPITVLSKSSLGKISNWANFKKCRGLHLELNMRTLRNLMSKTEDIWPQLLTGEKIDALRGKLKERLFGQDFVINKLTETLIRVRHNIEEQRNSNQKMYFLTDRYRYLELLQHHRGRYLLFDVTQEGDVIMIGIPSPSFYKEFTDKLDKRGVQLNDIA